MDKYRLKGLLVAALSMTVLIGTFAYASGFKMKQVNALIKDGGASMSEVEDKFGTSFQKVDVGGSEYGCVEGWFYTEAVTKRGKVTGVQTLVVYFDEDGYVCGTYITDGEKLDEERNREPDS
jgi:hypothetical protein